MEKLIEKLLDKYYRKTGQVGLWGSGLYTKDFLEWVVNYAQEELKPVSPICDERLSSAVYEFYSAQCKRFAEKEAEGYFGWDDENNVTSHNLARDLSIDATSVFPGKKYNKLIDIANRAMILWYRNKDQEQAKKETVEADNSTSNNSASDAIVPYCGECQSKMVCSIRYLANDPNLIVELKRCTYYTKEQKRT